MATKRGKRGKAEAGKHPTVVDIAARAGVAPMTVSRVINESGYASEAMREKVKRAVKELNYHPNGLARSLKRQSTQVVGILLPDIVNPFSAELVRGIQEVLLSRGYASFICTSERSIEREQAGLRALFDHRVDGIIVATRETPNGNEWLRSLVDRNLPVAVVGRDFEHPRVDRVTADHEKGGYEATKHLIAGGHKRVAFVGVSLQSGAGLRRFQGYLAALRDHRLPVEEAWIVGPDSLSGPGFSTQDDGYQGMKRLLALRKPPTAVFARNDFTAIGAMCALRDHGLSVPDNVSIVGFDNVSLAAYTWPPLTTIDQPTVEQGRQAASLLLERIEDRRDGRSRDRIEINLNCHLIIRQSTGHRKAGRR
ncbi:MAG: LacI family DNA-binding transcriptional regulator [Blastocatellia bacterium]